jgi:hypothetical protein
MDQVSRPMRIVLAAVIVLAVVWFVALRPKAPDIASTPAAPVTVITTAKDASDAADAANAKIQAATGGAKTPTPGRSVTPAVVATPSAATAKSAGRAKAGAAKTGDAAVVREIRSGKVVVMLFWNAKAAEDVATRRAVLGLKRRGGKVAVHVIPISRVARYESITDGVTINQSPTVLVVGPKGRTHAIVGLTERGELTQAVNDALAGRR